MQYIQYLYFLIKCKNLNLTKKKALPHFKFIILQLFNAMKIYLKSY